MGKSKDVIEKRERRRIPGGRKQQTRKNGGGRRSMESEKLSGYLGLCIWEGQEGRELCWLKFKKKKIVWWITRGRKCLKGNYGFMESGEGQLLKRQLLLSSFLRRGNA